MAHHHANCGPVKIGRAYSFFKDKKSYRAQTDREEREKQTLKLERKIVGKRTEVGVLSGRGQKGAVKT